MEWLSTGRRCAYCSDCLVSKAPVPVDASSSVSCIRFMAFVKIALSKGYNMSSTQKRKREGLDEKVSVSSPPASTINKTTTTNPPPGAVHWHRMVKQADATFAAERAALDKVLDLLQASLTGPSKAIIADDEVYDGASEKHNWMRHCCHVHIGRALLEDDGMLLRLQRARAEAVVLIGGSCSV